MDVDGPEQTLMLTPIPPEQDSLSWRSEGSNGIKLRGRLWRSAVRHPLRSGLSELARLPIQAVNVPHHDPDAPEATAATIPS